MSTEGSEEQQETGSALRSKLEEALGEARVWREAAVNGVVAKFPGVKTEDLSDVSYDQLEVRAGEIQAQREAEREGVLKEALEAKGLAGDELESALKALTGDKPPETPKPSSQVASLGKLAGSPPARGPQTEGLWGPDKIRAVVANSK